MKKASLPNELNFQTNTKSKIQPKKTRLQEQDFQKHKNVAAYNEKFQWQEQAKQNFDVQQEIKLKDDDQDEYMKNNIESFENTNAIQSSFKKNAKKIQESLRNNLQKAKDKIETFDQKLGIKKPEKAKVIAKISLEEQEKVLQRNLLLQQLSSQQQQQIQSEIERKDYTIQSEISSISRQINTSSVKSSLKKQEEANIQTSQRRHTGTKDFSSISSSSNVKNMPLKQTNGQFTLFQNHLTKNLPKTQQKTQLNQQQQSYFSVSREKQQTINMQESKASPSNYTQNEFKSRKSIKFNDQVEYLDSIEQKNKDKKPQAKPERKQINQQQNFMENENSHPHDLLDDFIAEKEMNNKIGKVDLLDLEEEENCEMDDFFLNLQENQYVNQLSFQQSNQMNDNVNNNLLDDFRGSGIQQSNLTPQPAWILPSSSSIQASGFNQNNIESLKEKDGIKQHQIFDPFDGEVIERSRKRTEKQKKKKKQKDQQSRKNLDLNKLPNKQFIRSMKDIESGSQRTSYALTKRSFKWSKSIFSSGKSSLQNGQISKEQIEYVSKLANKQGLTDSSEDSMEIEEFVNELEIKNKKEISKYYAFSSSDEITEQKGFKHKQKILKNYQEEKIKKDLSEIDQIEGLKALQSFYKMLQVSNHTDIVSSVEAFGEAMTLFIESQKLFSHIITLDSFVYFSSIGEGSFGTVDLYFFKQSKLIESNSKDSNYLQQTWHTSNHTSNSTVKNSFPQNMLLSSNQSNAPNVLQFSNLSLQQNQNPMIFSSEMQQAQSNTQNNQNSLKNARAINQDMVNSIEKQQSVYIEKTDSEDSKNTQEEVTAQKFQEMQYLPVACKKIENLEEYQRELFIMQTVKCEYMPKLFYLDLDKQLLFMELGLCSLEDLKNDSEENGYKFSDEFTYQVLVNLIKAVESLLSNYNSETQQKQPLFHSDIKPSNVMLTVKKYKNQPTCSIKLLLIDYGGSSFALEDYWAFYTPAFVSSDIWEKLIKRAQSGQCLSWEEIRYAEVYAACRSIQFLLVPEQEKELFKKENYNQFLNQYSYLYPKTCSILRQVYFRENIGYINNIYENVLSESEKTLYTGLNPQNIPFESHKIFELSKFYNCLSVDQKEQPNQNIDSEKMQNHQTENPFLQNNLISTQFVF
ncbi:hypothetical protein ABPG72_022616 [Tetrahymena utriculariae]